MPASAGMTRKEGTIMTDTPVHFRFGDNRALWRC